MLMGPSHCQDGFITSPSSQGHLRPADDVARCQDKSDSLPFVFTRPACACLFHLVQYLCFTSLPPQPHRPYSSLLQPSMRTSAQSFLKVVVFGPENTVMFLQPSLPLFLQVPDVTLIFSQYPLPALSCMQQFNSVLCASLCSWSLCTFSCFLVHKSSY